MRYRCLAHVGVVYILRRMHDHELLTFPRMHIMYMCVKANQDNDVTRCFPEHCTHTHTISIPLSLPPFLHHSISSPSHPLSLSLSLSPAIDLQIPRPDKKSGAKKQMKGMEDLLRSIAGNPHLRSNQAFITFLRPDDQFGSFTENDHSEVVSEYCIIHTLPRGP